MSTRVRLFRGAMTGRVYAATRWHTEGDRFVADSKSDVTEDFTRLSAIGAEESVKKARIEVQVYPDAEGKLRWRIRSAHRGRDIVADSAESYSRKTDCFRGLLLVTGGRYTQHVRFQAVDGHFYEQGAILRRTPEGVVEDIFVEYTSPGGAE